MNASPAVDPGAMPVHPDPDSRARPSERRQPGRKHILAVDGASEFLDVLRMLFETEEYQVTTTSFLDHTHAVIAALRPDLVIVDLAVGHEAGWELLEELHRAVVTREIPLLVTSTAPALLDRARSEAARYGVHRAIAKPMDVDELLGTVHALIGSA